MSPDNQTLPDSKKLRSLAGIIVGGLPGSISARQRRHEIG